MIAKAAALLARADDVVEEAYFRVWHFSDVAVQTDGVSFRGVKNFTVACVGQLADIFDHLRAPIRCR
jgi:hypothetical protein